MTPLIDTTWDLVCCGAQLMCDADNTIIFDENAKTAYEENFEKEYRKILSYMKDKDHPLDRHKEAAIVITSTIHAKVITTHQEGKIFLGPYVLASQAGWSHLRGELNRCLAEKGIKHPIKSLYFPKAYACKTDYCDIFYRNLYFADTNGEWGLNPLDIAERLFLLEYTTLKHNMIDPALLREY